MDVLCDYSSVQILVRLDRELLEVINLALLQAHAHPFCHGFGFELLLIEVYGGLVPLHAVGQERGRRRQEARRLYLKDNPFHPSTVL